MLMRALQYSRELAHNGVSRGHQSERIPLSQTIQYLRSNANPKFGWDITRYATAAEREIWDRLDVYLKAVRTLTPSSPIFLTTLLANKSSKAVSSSKDVTEISKAPFFNKEK